MIRLKNHSDFIPWKEIAYKLSKYEMKYEGAMNYSLKKWLTCSWGDRLTHTANNVKTFQEVWQSMWIWASISICLSNDLFIHINRFLDNNVWAFVILHVILYIINENINRFFNGYVTVTVFWIYTTNIRICFGVNLRQCIYDSVPVVFNSDSHFITGFIVSSKIRIT